MKIEIAKAIMREQSAVAEARVRFRAAQLFQQDFAVRELEFRNADGLRNDDHVVDRSGSV